MHLSTTGVTGRDRRVLQPQLDSSCLWAVGAKLATLYGKTFPGSDGAKALTWYRHAATFTDRSEDQETRVWVRGRAAIALGERPSLGLLNAVMGKAHVARSGVTLVPR